MWSLHIFQDMAGCGVTIYSLHKLQIGDTIESNCGTGEMTAQYVLKECPTYAIRRKLWRSTTCSISGQTLGNFNNLKCSYLYIYSGWQLKMCKKKNKNIPSLFTIPRQFPKKMSWYPCYMGWPSPWAIWLTIYVLLSYSHLVTWESRLMKDQTVWLAKLPWQVVKQWIKQISWMPLGILARLGIQALS